MKFRTLGRSGLKVSEIGLGTEKFTILGESIKLKQQDKKFFTRVIVDKN